MLELLLSHFLSQNMDHSQFLLEITQMFSSFLTRDGTKNPAQFYPPGLIRFYPAGKTQKNLGYSGFYLKIREFQDKFTI